MMKIRIQDLVISIIILSAAVNGLPRIRSESDEEVELPSTSAEQGILKRIFRNSQEMDQTGFHPELDTENRNFLEVDAGAGTSPPNTLDDAPSDASVAKEAGTPPDASADDGSSFVEENADLQPLDNGDVVVLVKEAQLKPIMEEYEKEVHEENEGVTRLAGTDVAGAVNSETQGTSDEQLSETSPTRFHVDDEHHLGVPMDLMAMPPQGMNPPPFLVTKPLFGQVYVYQLRYPKPQYEPVLTVANKEYLPTEDDTVPGLNAKNVYGPPLPIDITKLQKKERCPYMERMKKELASLPLTMPEAPGGVKVHHASSAAPTNVFLFFSTCPHGGGGAV